ncbi:MAG: hypothetical protein M5U31_14430 [Acidimicrobiia bacterium]|nr:hypothetical protein [Acidimicrobiia bacterium]
MTLTSSIIRPFTPPSSLARLTRASAPTSAPEKFTLKKIPPIFTVSSVTPRVVRVDGSSVSVLSLELSSVVLSQPAAMSATTAIAASPVRHLITTYPRLPRLPSSSGI